MRFHISPVNRGFLLSSHSHAAEPCWDRMTSLWTKSDSLDFTRLYLEPGLITLKVQLSAAVQVDWFAAVTLRHPVARRRITPLKKEKGGILFDQKKSSCSGQVVSPIVHIQRHWVSFQIILRLNNTICCHICLFHRMLKCFVRIITQLFSWHTTPVKSK